LDEPTTGLDPKSKRDVWELITELKKDKLVILTTHSMEECDALADRIAIMANGNIKCLGDSLYLKNKYGGGYSLTLNLNEIEKSEEMIALVKQHFENSNVISSNSGNILFKLTSNTGEFTELLKEIEIKEEEKIVKNWSISQTTLEEVYLSVTKSE
jgi:ABC-type multidrug transport system ATPase subunit